jgi:hypothetical protein
MNIHSDTGPADGSGEAGGRLAPTPSRRLSINKKACHAHPPTPRDIAPVAYALPTRAWKQLRKEDRP